MSASGQIPTPLVFRPWGSREGSVCLLIYSAQSLTLLYEAGTRETTSCSWSRVIQSNDENEDGSFAAQILTQVLP